MCGQSCSVHEADACFRPQPAVCRQEDYAGRQPAGATFPPLTCRSTCPLPALLAQPSWRSRQRTCRAWCSSAPPSPSSGGLTGARMGQLRARAGRARASCLHCLMRATRVRCCSCVATSTSMWSPAPTSLRRHLPNRPLRQRGGPAFTAPTELCSLKPAHAVAAPGAAGTSPSATITWWTRRRRWASTTRRAHAWTTACTCQRPCRWVACVRRCSARTGRGGWQLGNCLRLAALPRDGSPSLCMHPFPTPSLSSA